MLSSYNLLAIFIMELISNYVVNSIATLLQVISYIIHKLYHSTGVDPGFSERESEYRGDL